MHLKKFRHFSGDFLAMVITATKDNFWQTVFLFLKGCPFTTRIATFMWGLGNLFLKIVLEIQKTAGSSVDYAHIPLEKLSYKIKLMTPPRNQILD
jgi:hypothetical protein